MKLAIQPYQDIVSIPLGSLSLSGTLQIPSGATGAVLFVHHSGCCHNSPYYHYIARVLQRAGLGSLLLDLLTPELVFSSSIRLSQVSLVATNYYVDSSQLPQLICLQQRYSKRSVVEV